MANFPITCVDNFYSNPDKVREFALSLKYFKEENVIYPGERTEPIYLMDSDFFRLFSRKIFSLFFDLNFYDVRYSIQTAFQKIYKYECSENDFNEVNSGWVHDDDSTILAGVIYLNPSPNLDSGTSFYQSYRQEYSMRDTLKIRSDFYNHQGLPSDEYASLKKIHHSQFYKVAEFNNVYNRMVAYDGTYLHRESSFVMDSEDFRLTQVFFVKDLEIPDKTQTPIMRSK